MVTGGRSNTKTPANTLLFIRRTLKVIEYLLCSPGQFMIRGARGYFRVVLTGLQFGSLHSPH